MKRAAVVASFFLLAISQMALAQSLDWRRVSPAGTDYSVLFPANPTENPPDADKGPDGSVRSTTRVAQFSGNGIFCGSSVADYNFTFDPNAELDADRESFLKSVHGTLGTSQRGEFTNGSDKLPELTFDFQAPEMGYRGKAIVVVKGNSAYMLVFLFSKDHDYTAEMERFLSSLEFAPAKK